MRTVAETPGCHNARISTQTIRNRLGRFTLRVGCPYRGPILNRQRCAPRLHWVTSQQSGTGFYFLPMSPGFVSPIVMDGSRCGIAEVSVMATSTLLNRTNGTAGV